MSKQHDTVDQDVIVCPHCGYKDQNSWEQRLGDGDAVVNECRKCTKSFRVIAIVSRTYTTWKLADGGRES